MYAGIYIMCQVTQKSCDSAKQPVSKWKYTCFPLCAATYTNAKLFAGIEHPGNRYRMWIYAEKLLRRDDVGSGVTYPTDVKFACFKAYLEGSRASRYTNEFWYRKTSVCKWQYTYIYIVIYMYRDIYLCFYSNTSDKLYERQKNTWK